MDGGIGRALEPVLAMWPLVRARARTLCGLVLREDQAYLLTRLEPVARQLNYPSLALFLSATLAGNKPELDRALVEALTTHETSFFRDPGFWDVMRTRVLPDIIGKMEKGRPLRFWSAASSTGQEAYSFAIIMADWFPNVAYEGWATDVAEDTLDRASRGIFTNGEIERGMPQGSLGKHFDKHTVGWQAKAYLRAPFRFDKFNLLGAALPLGSFDVVMCRNVLVYFDADDRNAVIERLVKALTPRGWLGLGSTELPTSAQKNILRLPDGAGWMHRQTP
jgi:chemotaxis protein methyltransferase CheR